MTKEATNFDKQWEEAARKDRIMTEFYANFQTHHPNVKLVLIHDSCLFEKQEDYLLFKDELEQFMKEKGGNKCYQTDQE